LERKRKRIPVREHWQVLMLKFSVGDLRVGRLKVKAGYKAPQIPDGGQPRAKGDTAKNPRGVRRRVYGFSRNTFYMHAIINTLLRDERGWW
jgi:hypothetical protein